MGMRQKRQKAPPEGFRPGNRPPPLSPLALYPRRGSPKAGGEVFALRMVLAGHLRQCQTAPKGRGLCCA